MQETGGVMLVCSVEDILGKGGAEFWQVLFDIGWGLWEGRDTQLKLQWWDGEQSLERERDGGSRFLRSKSFKTEETLFLRNIKVVPGMCAGYSGKERIGF